MSVTVGHPPTPGQGNRWTAAIFAAPSSGDMSPWNWPPDNPTHTIWLHERCEMPWYDTNGLPEGVEKTAHSGLPPGSSHGPPPRPHHASRRRPRNPGGKASWRG
jgi:hypothetical protein